MKKKIIIKPKADIAAGAFVVKDGKVEPDLKDEAMKSKFGAKKEVKDVK